jgi:hypothetical protein
MIASLPAIYLAAWLALFSVSGLYQPYGPMFLMFLALLPLAILVDVLAFVVPMRSIHKLMREQKEVIMWKKADELSRIIAARQARVDAQICPTRKDGEPDLTDLIDRSKVLEKTPTWPVDRTIWRRFTLRNLGLALPLIGYVAGNADFWQKLSDVLKGL